MQNNDLAEFWSAVNVCLLFMLNVLYALEVALKVGVDRMRE